MSNYKKDWISNVICSCSTTQDVAQARADLCLSSYENLLTLSSYICDSSLNEETYDSCMLLLTDFGNTTQYVRVGDLHAANIVDEYQQFITINDNIFEVGSIVQQIADQCDNQYLSYQAYLAIASGDSNTFMNQILLKASSLSSAVYQYATSLFSFIASDNYSSADKLATMDDLSGISYCSSFEANDTSNFDTEYTTDMSEFTGASPTTAFINSIDLDIDVEGLVETAVNIVVTVVGSVVSWISNSVKNLWSTAVTYVNESLVEQKLLDDPTGGESTIQNISFESKLTTKRQVFPELDNGAKSIYTHFFNSEQMSTHSSDEDKTYIVTKIRPLNSEALLAYMENFSESNGIIEYDFYSLTYYQLNDLLGGMQYLDLELSTDASNADIVTGVYCSQILRAAIGQSITLVDTELTRYFASSASWLTETYEDTSRIITTTEVSSNYYVNPAHPLVMALNHLYEWLTGSVKSVMSINSNQFSISDIFSDDTTDYRSNLFLARLISQNPITIGLGDGTTASYLSFVGFSNNQYMPDGSYNDNGFFDFDAYRLVMYDLMQYGQPCDPSMAVARNRWTLDTIESINLSTWFTVAEVYGPYSTTTSVSSTSRLRTDSDASSAFMSLLSTIAISALVVVGIVLTVKAVTTLKRLTVQKAADYSTAQWQYTQAILDGDTETAASLVSTLYKANRSYSILNSITGVFGVSSATSSLSTLLSTSDTVTFDTTEIISLIK